MSIHDFIIEGDSLIISKALSDLSPLLLQLPQLFMGFCSLCMILVEFIFIMYVDKAIALFIC